MADQDLSDGFYWVLIRLRDDKPASLPTVAHYSGGRWWETHGLQLEPHEVKVLSARLEPPVG